MRLVLCLLQSCIGSPCCGMTPLYPWWFMKLGIFGGGGLYLTGSLEVQGFPAFQPLVEAQWDSRQ